MMNEREIRNRIERMEELKKTWHYDTEMVTRLDIRIETLKAVLKGGTPREQKPMLAIIEVA